MRKIHYSTHTACDSKTGDHFAAEVFLEQMVLFHDYEHQGWGVQK